MADALAALAMEASELAAGCHEAEKADAPGEKGEQQKVGIKSEIMLKTDETPDAPPSPKSKLKYLANTFKSLPSILRKRKKPTFGEKEIRVKAPKWETIKKKRSEYNNVPFSLNEIKNVQDRGPRQYVQKVVQARSPAPGASKYMNKYYTSKYRGVHQTFPTRRWEAQFRKSGKPTSLGCFNSEEEAARAYDTMMIWCMIHQPENARPDKTITNFSISDYDVKIPELTQITQEELVLALRRLGRKQAGEYSQNGGGAGKSTSMLQPLHENVEEARIREDLGLGNKDPTCRQMFEKISEQAPEFLPEKSKGGKYVLGTLKMQRTTLVKAYLKWLDSRSGKGTSSSKSNKSKASTSK